MTTGYIIREPREVPPPPLQPGFFPKAGQGLLALAAGGPMMHYCRVTTTELPKGTTPMRRPRGVQ